MKKVTGIKFGFCLFIGLFSGLACAQNNVVVVPLDIDFSYANFSGPQRGLKRAELEAVGWSVCYTDLYDVRMTTATVLSNCDGANLLLACGPAVDTNAYSLAAYAPRADVIFDTGTDETTTHRANGSEWYFNNNRSWGFVTAGEAVFKSSADVNFGDGDEFRLSWHTRTSGTLGGYRCGTTEGLNSSTDWRRTVMQRD